MLTLDVKDPRLKRLQAVLESYESALVAFSGGVDSTLVAAVAFLVLGKKSLAVTGLSPSLSEREQDLATKLALDLGIPHRTLKTFEMQSQGYQENAGDRCYYCKSELFTRLATLASQENFQVVLSGDNLDDLGGHRPGMKAAEEQAVRHPLIEAQFSKKDVRDIARMLGLPNHEKPASPCLASRVPAGIRVSPEVLSRVELAEAAIRELGFSVLRVRHHGDLARIEVPAVALERAFSLRDDLSKACLDAGYTWASLDLKGFRSGSLQELTPPLSPGALKV